MAWIVKDVANEQIDRQHEPYLTDKLRKRFEKQVLGNYATKQAALLPVCHEIQHEYGYLPAQALEEVAEFLELSSSQVMDTVTFYEEFRLKPLGNHVIQICRSISCELCGCNGLSKQIQDKLNILPGETTDDGKFTLQELECIGACEMAPAALIDEKLTGPHTWDSLEEKIDELATED